MTRGGGRILRVLVTDPGDPAALEALRAIPAFELIERPGLERRELRRALGTMDAVIARTSTTLPREMLTGSSQLKAIARPGVGVDNIDIDAASELGIAIVNAPRGNTISAAEHTLGLMLALARGLPAADRSIRQGAWDRSCHGRELYGLTLGILGLGRIGREIASRALAFRMRIVGFDPLLADERARELGVQPAPLSEVVRSADVLTLHVPLSSANRGLIGRSELAAMKPGSFLINAARGGVVDQAALLDALDSGHLAGAALDVFEREPLPADHPLRRRVDVVVTPHIGAATVEAQRRVGVEIADALSRVLLEGDVTAALNGHRLASELGPSGPDIALAADVARRAAGQADAPIDAVDVLADTAEDGRRAIAAGAAAGVLETVLGPGSSRLADALEIMADRGIPVRASTPPERGGSPPRIEVRLELRSGSTRARAASR